MFYIPAGEGDIKDCRIIKGIMEIMKDIASNKDQKISNDSNKEKFVFISQTSTIGTILEQQTKLKVIENWFGELSFLAPARNNWRDLTRWWCPGPEYKVFYSWGL